MVYGPTKQKVQEKLRKLYDAAGVPRELARLTVEGYLTRWLELVKPTVEYGTFKPYKNHVEHHLVPIIGTLRLVELKRFHIEELYTTLAKKEVSPAMQRKIGTTLTIGNSSQGSDSRPAFIKAGSEANRVFRSSCWRS